MIGGLPGLTLQYDVLFGRSAGSPRVDGDSVAVSAPRRSVTEGDTRGDEHVDRGYKGHATTWRITGDNAGPAVR